METDRDTHQATYSPYWWASPFHTHGPGEQSSAALEHPGDKREQATKIGLAAIQRRIDERREEERRERDEGIYGFLSAPAYFLVGMVLFAIWGTLIYFLNKWGKEASDATDPRVVEAYLGTGGMERK